MNITPKPLSTNPCTIQLNAYQFQYNVMNSFGVIKSVSSCTSASKPSFFGLNHFAISVSPQIYKDISERVFLAKLWIYSNRSEHVGIFLHLVSEFGGNEMNHKMPKLRMIIFESYLAAKYTEHKVTGILFFRGKEMNWKGKIIIQHLFEKQYILAVWN